ncbi:hypothetical protein [Lewinella sp. IMCC34183]|uniref:hypothetical protein n=1 Tax=Lewinella sp. IMCC34183 TaxID=2248762 RepID=UPI00130058BF|nr:hypothetical protein [Lewinella sp. IMCC34183]
MPPCADLLPHLVYMELDGDEVKILHTKIGENTSHNWPDGDDHLGDSILRQLDVTPREFARIEDILGGLHCIGFSNFREEDKFAFSGQASGCTPT